MTTGKHPMCECDRSLDPTDGPAGGSYCDAPCLGSSEIRAASDADVDSHVSLFSILELVA